MKKFFLFIIIFATIFTGNVVQAQLLDDEPEESLFITPEPTLGIPGDPGTEAERFRQQREDDVVTVPSGLSPLSFEGAREIGDICSGRFEGDRVGFILCRAARLINVFLAGLAALSILPIVIGGVNLIISQGNADRVEKGKKSLFWGVVGLALAFSAIVVFRIFLAALLPGTT